MRWRSCFLYKVLSKVEVGEMVQWQATRAAVEADSDATIYPGRPVASSASASCSSLLHPSLVAKERIMVGAIVRLKHLKLNAWLS